MPYTKKTRLTEQQIKQSIFLIIEEEITKFYDKSMLKTVAIDTEKLLANINGRIEKLLDEQEAILVYRP